MHLARNVLFNTAHFNNKFTRTAKSNKKNVFSLNILKNARVYSIN